MTTRNAPVAHASAYSRPEEWRHLDPVTAEIMARYARQEMMAKFLRDVWKAATKAVARWYRNRVVYQDLSELPDHLLDDIGIRRDQVSAIAYGGLTRPATDLELAAGRGSISFFEQKPAPVAAAPRDDASGDGKPLAA